MDGAITSATNAEPMKFFEVSKIINYWFLAGASSEWLVTNQKAWDGLPKDLQQIVLDALKEVRFEDKEWEDAKAFEERALKRFPEIGMTVVNPSKEEIDKARTAVARGVGHVAHPERRRRQARHGAGPQGPRSVIGRASKAASLLGGLATLVIAGAITSDVLLRYFLNRRCSAWTRSPASCRC